MRYEYKREYVPRYYSGNDRDMTSPEKDVLTNMGIMGWLLCAIGPQDSGGTKIIYFVREINEE